LFFLPLMQNAKVVLRVAIHGANPFVAVLQQFRLMQPLFVCMMLLDHLQVLIYIAKSSCKYTPVLMVRFLRCQ
jgi:hypothetical protein